jgi:hypothetical protein
MPSTPGKTAPQDAGVADSATPAQTLVIIPAFNEEKSIAAVVREARAALPGADVVVVDDGSADSTAERAQVAGAWLLRLPCNLGVGAALQTGLKLAEERGYRYAVRLDGDGQHDANEARRLLEAVRTGEADVASGSRFLAQVANAPAEAYMPPTGRSLGIRILARLIGLLTRQHVTDPTSGLYSYNRRVICYLARHHPQDYPEVEARIMLQRRGFRLVELPTVMRPRLAGNSSIRGSGSIYYMLRVAVAALIAALRTPAPLPEADTEKVCNPEPS